MNGCIVDLLIWVREALAAMQEQRQHGKGLLKLRFNAAR
jgi:hypothetical protein